MNSSAFNSQLLLTEEEKTLLQVLTANPLKGVYVQGGNHFPYQINHPGKYSIPSLWLDCGVMIRLGVYSIDIREKVELFPLAISEDKDFSGIETNLMFRPKRAKVSIFPDDLRLDDFFLSQTTVLKPRPSSVESFDSEVFQVHDRLEIVNDLGKKLILIADEEIPCNLVLWIENV
jgi:hypothetical protein